METVEFIDVDGIVPQIERALAEGTPNIAFRGPSGTGKTLLVRNLAEKHNKTLYTFNMTVHTGVEELKGRYVVMPSSNGVNMRWIDGQLVQAMREGDWVVIEEANFMQEEISSVLYSVMDHRREIVLDEHENEVIHAHPDFRLFLTMNWGYKGTNFLNDAIRNRIDLWYDLKYLPFEQECELLVRCTGIELRIAQAMVKLAEKLRGSKEKGQPDISTRILLKWAWLTRMASPTDAAERTIIPLIYYDEKEKEKVREVVRFFFKEPKRYEFSIGDMVTYKDRLGNASYGIVEAFEEKPTGDGVVATWADTKEELAEGKNTRKGWCLAVRLRRVEG